VSRCLGTARHGTLAKRSQQLPEPPESARLVVIGDEWVVFGHQVRVVVVSAFSVAERVRSLLAGGYLPGAEAFPVDAVTAIEYRLCGQ